MIENVQELNHNQLTTEMFYRVNQHPSQESNQTSKIIKKEWEKEKKNPRSKNISDRTIMFVCVCVCVCVLERESKEERKKEEQPLPQIWPFIAVGRIKTSAPPCWNLKSLFCRSRIMLTPARISNSGHRLLTVSQSMANQPRLRARNNRPIVTKKIPQKSPLFMVVKTKDR